MAIYQFLLLFQGYQSLFSISRQNENADPEGKNALSFLLYLKSRYFPKDYVFHIGIRIYIYTFFSCQCVNFTLSNPYAITRYIIKHATIPRAYAIVLTFKLYRSNTCSPVVIGHV